MPKKHDGGFENKVDPRRVERTLLHKKIGLFGYSREFARRGIVSPYLQVFLIARIIAEHMRRAQQLPSLSDEAEVKGWLENAVEEQISDEITQQAKVGSLDKLALTTVGVIAWNPHRDFAELLNAYCGPKAYDNVANKLNRQGYHVGIDDLSELTQPFLRLSLGRAVRSFDPEVGIGRETEWLTTVFYRFILKHVISDQQNKLSLEEIKAAEIASPSPMEELESESRESALFFLPEALDRLPEQDRKALELYFGFHGRERTLNEIATELGTSQYLARAQIVQSLGVLASKLGIERDLDQNEYSLLQMLFGEGMEIRVAAKKLEISEREVRSKLQRIKKKLNEGLRERTKKPWKYDAQTELSEESTMSTEFMLSDEQIISGLKQLIKTPELCPSENGLQARISNRWVPVRRVQEVVFRRHAGEGLIPSLEEKGINLGWLITPDSMSERADLPADYYERGEELQAIADRAWITAEVLYVRTLEKANEYKVSIPAEPKQEGVERVYRTLGGISQAIERELPRSLRRKGECYFRMERRRSGEVTGAWEGGGEDQRFEMLREFKYRAALLGELPEEVAVLLTEVMIEEIFEGDMTLPSFRRLDQSTRETVWFKLLPRTIEASLDALKSR